MTSFRIGDRLVGGDAPVYFIAEIGSNHGGSLRNALSLCDMAKESRADCVKFQHYRADTLASHYGFTQVGNLAHYTENPYDVFKRYEVPWSWIEIIKKHCDNIGIEFMSTPYDLEAVDRLEPYVNAYKIGSGDITYHELIRRAASKGKPIIISTGASNMEEIEAAVGSTEIEEEYFGEPYTVTLEVPVALLQCNTNYSTWDYWDDGLNLAVLSEWKQWGIVVGVSDHKVANEPIIAAVALGAKIVERHFTRDVQSCLSAERDTGSPDSLFALKPSEFAFMVNSVRMLERGLKPACKKVETNEEETVVLQRRCVRTTRLLAAGDTIRNEHLVCLRPAPLDSFPPYALEALIGKKVNRDISAGDYIRTTDV